MEICNLRKSIIGLAVFGLLAVGALFAETLSISGIVKYRYRWSRKNSWRVPLRRPWRRRNRLAVYDAVAQAA